MGRACFVTLMATLAVSSRDCGQLCGVRGFQEAGSFGAGGWTYAGFLYCSLLFFFLANRGASPYDFGADRGDGGGVGMAAHGAAPLCGDGYRGGIRGISDLLVVRGAGGVAEDWRSWALVGWDFCFDGTLASGFSRA